MEEILASIRRIISDEVASGGREPAGSPRSVRDVAEPSSDAGFDAQASRPDLPAADQLAAAAVAARADEAHAADVEPAGAVGQEAAPADGGHDAAEAAPVPRRGPALPAFVSRNAMNAARTEPTRFTSHPGYAPGGRAPAVDPFVTGRRVAAAALDQPLASTRPEPSFTPAPRPSLARAAARVAVAETVPDFGPIAAPQPIDVPDQDERQDQDERFAAALLDLDLVEQAVQAELAIMSSEATEAATAQSDATQVIMPDPVASAPAVTAHFDELVSFVPAAPSPAMSSTAPSPEMNAAPETADMQVQAKPAAASRTSAPESTEDRRTEGRGEPRFFPPRPVETAAAEAPNRLVSGTTTTAVSAAFGSLARTVASNSRTVDDLVTEAIRPMLKEWLDENLPALVERLVRAEIERVSRQGQ